MQQQVIQKDSEIKQLFANTPIYPEAVRHYFADSAPESITAIGNLKILKQKKLALFCSVKCPGDIILQAYDLAQALRDAGVTVIGGFHSPMEREVLNILLRSPNPVIVCPARGIEGMRLPNEYKEPLAEDRLLLLSPFEKNKNRPTAETSIIRNKFVAALADKIFVAHAAPGSKTEQFCHEILTWRKALFTFENDDNNKLIELGAKPIQTTDVKILL